jgi:hypothetical protein
VVDDPDMLLTAAQVAALVDATPWPCNVMLHTAAWSGLRAAELAGLVIGDVELPEPSMNRNAPAKPGVLRVERTVIDVDGVLVYDTPKTNGSRRRVPLTAQTTELGVGTTRLPCASVALRPVSLDRVSVTAQNSGALGSSRRGCAAR